MLDDHATTRRRFLRTAGATLSAVGMAGCSETPFAEDVPPSVTAAPVPRSPTRRPLETSTFTPTDTARASSGADQVVELVDFAFEPGTESPVLVPAGSTVGFVWRTANHNLRVDRVPSGAAWAGHEPIEDAGFVHEHRFETPGRYAFHCEPHRGLGMVGTMDVR